MIGVVGDMRERGLENEMTLAVYFPAYGGAMDATTLNLVMHTRGKPGNVTPALRAIVSGIDPTLPVSNIRTLEEIVTASVATRRFTMLLVVTFAGLASYSRLRACTVCWRMVRAAHRGNRHQARARCAAWRRDPAGSHARPGARDCRCGSRPDRHVWLSRFMTTLVFGITATDPATDALVSLALIGTAVLACYLPARQGAEGRSRCGPEG